MNRYSSLFSWRLFEFIILAQALFFVLGCSAGRAITISYVNLSVDDWSSVKTESFSGGKGGKGAKGPVLRLEFASDKDLVSVYSEDGKNVWPRLTDCNEKALDRWPYVFIGAYPIGGTDQYGKSFPLPVRKNDADRMASNVYHVYFDFFSRRRDRNYDLRTDNFNVCLQIGAGSMLPFSGIKSNVIVIKNSKIKSVLGIDSSRID